MIKNSGPQPLCFAYARPFAVLLLLAMIVMGHVALPAAAAVGATVADCGDVFTYRAGGIHDYTDPEAWRPDGVPIVNKHHFTPSVENLTAGISSANPLDDLDFVLRAVPNHHRALNAVVRYELERGGTPPQYRSVECWFDRAFRFRPDDGAVWLIYGNYKSRKKQWDEAIKSYTRAKSLMPDNVEIDYNLGLLYLNTGDYAKAAEHAKVAYAQGYPLQGLKRKLADKGYAVQGD